MRAYNLKEKGPLKIRISKAFNSNVYRASLNIHLYFVKIFGCRIIEELMPIDIDSFSDSILNNKPNPHIFIFFEKAEGRGIETAQITPIDAALNRNQALAASWIYTVGDLNIEVMYLHNTAHVKFLEDFFHPRFKHKCVRFKDYEVDGSGYYRYLMSLTDIGRKQI